ncbi:flagellar basal body-associated FliL family protein [Vibrio furnissii]|uniref:flagellar basal body-associated FliL family protein n=1 Tax=Vibrio furnissii TaxID=29494 RepID=UPI001AFC3D3F|nr:flagellar basal body-associated FliL family protein [Vibrio furnissii]MCG6235902.1 flagellar basal body-associated FliL family protein [Vibrio furnissii]MCG6257693.1 flagellar basal body-associated FliL family protein [Vibrio furnissii]QSA19453.1 flagellar basal body-associated FliL family protein [Vibrio furnissii]
MTKQQLITVFIMMIITSALVSAGTVFGGIWYLKQQSAQQEQPSSDWLANSPLAFLSDTPQSPKAPSFHSLDKVVLSVKGKNQNHFLMLEIAVETRHPERIANIGDYMPVVRNSLIKLFSDKTYEDLQQDGAIEHLQNEVKLTILNAFEKTDILRDIDDVLLTKYVVQ